MEKSKEKSIVILVDGSNIALFNPTRKKLGRFDNLKTFMSFLNEIKKDNSIEYQILVDASLKHRIDKKKELEKAIKTGKIIQCPSGTQADYFILEYFKRHEDNVIVISNDNFSEYDVSNLKQCKFAFVLDEIILKPALEEFFKEYYKLLEGEKINA